MAEILNFTQERGDTFNLPIQFGENITGWVIFITLKKNIDDEDEDAVVSKEISDHTAPLDGITIIELTAEETTNLLGSYYYDIQYKETDDTITTLLKGTITFVKDITRRIS